MCIWDIVLWKWNLHFKCIGYFSILYDTREESSIAAKPHIDCGFSHLKKEYFSSIHHRTTKGQKTLKINKGVVLFPRYYHNNAWSLNELPTSILCVAQSNTCAISSLQLIHLRPITLRLLHHKYLISPFPSSISLCRLLKWDATPLEWYNSSSLGLWSLSGSLLSHLTYLEGFLKRSQRKLFSFLFSSHTH